MFAFLFLGIFSLTLIPREEEPQIEVPMADVMIGFPGAEPEEVASSIVAPLEKMISNIKGVENIYATAMGGQAMLTIQFYVGEDVERSIVKLYNELMKNMDKMPQGVTMPLVKTRAIDDVPALALTLWSKSESDYEIRRLGEVVASEIKKIPDIADIKVLGGRARQLKVILDKDKMAENKVDFISLERIFQGNNMQMNAGVIRNKDVSYSVETGTFLSSVEDVRNLIVGVNNQQVVYLYQIASIEDGPEVPSQYVTFGYGNAQVEKRMESPDTYSAVTLSIAKRKGADAMRLAEKVLEKTDHLKRDLITDDVHVEVTRNYGESASQKVTELLSHLIIAILVVTLFVALAMGWRGGLVVFLSVPVTFALTLFAYYFLDYTLNRITLFALVFVTGIVVDDSIIIAENMHRHFKLRKLSFMDAAIYAINEVGNPTILATLTVIAAVLPMAFVSGLMGPYMSPMPIGASIAMLISLMIALTLTPYFGYLFLRGKEKDEESKEQIEEQSEEKIEKNFIYRIYEASIVPFLESRSKRWTFMVVTLVILLGSMILLYTKAVPVKMLPFDNKNEFQVLIDMPEGTTLERTAAVTQELANYVADNNLVENYQAYVGTSAPISFNGLVRHYDFRRGENVADIQVNLVGKHHRSEQSHDIAVAMRPGLQEIGKRYNANVKVVEVPPGPPVMSTLVAEIYGPSYEGQLKVAEQVKDLFANTPSVVDIDWSAEDPQKEYKLTVDKEKAGRFGIAEAQIVYTVRSALSGMPVGVMHQKGSINQVGIVLQLSDVDKADIGEVRNLKIANTQGIMFPISDFISITEGTKERSIHRKNQKPVVYVLADMAGGLESPVYAITDISEHLKTIKLDEGYSLSEEYSSQPDLLDNYSLKWDGEWQITYEVFRDLGIAFILVILIIYVLIVGWFQNFLTPLVQLAAIPLSLIGILFGHWIMGAYFSAPSMIGFIALAGIMVRNSVLLIDFIEIRLKQGIPLKQAIIDAGAVRTMPILLTAGGVVLGAIVILFDPIFQGLAISLMGGTITSTILTLIVVPLLFFKLRK